MQGTAPQRRESEYDREASVSSPLLYDDDSSTASDIELRNQRKRRKYGKSSVFIDDECECSGSGHSESETESCSECEDFIDDNDIDTSADSNVYREQVQDIPIYDESIHKLDANMAKIKNNITHLESTHLISLLVSVLDAIQRVNAKGVHITIGDDTARSAVLMSFARRYLGLDLPIDTWRHVITTNRRISATYTMSLRKQLFDAKVALSKEIDENLVHDKSYQFTSDDVETLLGDVAQLFIKLKTDDIQEFIHFVGSVRSADNISHEVTERPKVSIPTSDSNNGQSEGYSTLLDEFSMPVETDDDDLSPAQAGPLAVAHKSGNDKTAAIVTDCRLADLIAGRCDSEYQKWLLANKFKTLIATKRKSLTPIDCTATGILKYFHEAYSSVLRETKCSPLAATKAAADILDAQLTAATLTAVPRDEPLTQESDVLSSQYVVNVDGTPFPDDDSLRLSLLWNKQDDRSCILETSWLSSCSYDSQLGAFECPPQTQCSRKWMYMAILGLEHSQKFHENVNEFLVHTSVNMYVAKNGIYAVKSTPKAVVKGSPVKQVLHCVLQLSRSTIFGTAAKQVLHYLQSISIPCTAVILATFCDTNAFSTVYADIEEMRRSSAESGFIGPVDKLMRQRLGINNDSEKETMAFTIMYRELKKVGCRTATDCVEHITKLIEDPSNESQEKQIFVSLMKNGTFAIQSVKSTLWWLDKLRCRKLPYERTEIGRISKQLAVMLFQDIKKLCGGHLLNPLVDIENWSEELMGPIRLKGKLFQPAIWKIITDYITAPTDLIRVLKHNKVSPTQFFNIYFTKIVLHRRRDKTLILSGGFKTGKSITANAIFSLHNGKRVALENIGGSGSSFTVDSVSDPNDDCGVVILEDVNIKTFRKIDQTIRPHLDGDLHCANIKYGGVTKQGKWPGCVITTNVPVDSESEDEDIVSHRKKPKDTMLRKGFLTARFTYIKMDQPLATHDKHIESIGASDILKLYWKYGFLPVCNALYSDAPRCRFSPCRGILYHEHHPMCGLVREIHSNLSYNVKPTLSTKDDGYTYESYERVIQDAVGACFDLNKVEDMREMMKREFDVSSIDTAHLTDEGDLREVHVKVAEIDHFIDHVWTPVCYLSKYMRGSYANEDKQKFKATHNLIIQSELFRLLSADEEPFSMSDLCGVSFESNNFEFNPGRRMIMRDNESLNAMIKLHHPALHPRCLKWSASEADSADKYSVLMMEDKRWIKSHLISYVKKTSHIHRWVAKKRWLTEMRISAMSFNELWLQIIGRNEMKNVADTQQMDVIDNLTLFD